MKKTTTRRAVVAGFAAGAIALGVPVSGIIAATTAHAQGAYSPTFNTQYVENVNAYATQIQQALASSGKTVSDDSLSQIFDIPFKEGKVSPGEGYKPTFSANATGDTPAEIEEFKARGFKLAQQLSDDDLKNAIAKIGGAPIDQNNAVEVPDATINPNQAGEEVNEAPPAPVVNDNSADNDVASANEADFAPVPESDNTEAENDTDSDDNLESESTESAESNTTNTQAQSPASQQASQPTNAPTLANTGAPVIGLIALGGLASAAGAMTLRRKN